MKGKNTIRLNNAAMLAAMQLWADSAFTTKPAVTAVRQIHPNGYGEAQTPGCYEIDVDGSPAQDEERVFTLAKAAIPE